MNEKHKKTVIVTGASTGIGLSTALLLSKNGYRVFAGYRKEEDGQKLKKMAQGNLTPIRLDVLNGDDVAKVRELVLTELDGKLDALINNAGIFHPLPFEVAGIDSMREQMEVNYMGPVILTKTLLPMLRKAKGRIVNISSMNGRVTMPICAGYSAAKFALEAFSEALRIELQATGVKVSLIEPGQIKTPIFNKGIEMLTEAVKDWSQEFRDLYLPLYKSGLGAIEGGAASGKPPEAVAEVIEQALSADNPHTRYVVGEDAKAFIEMREKLADHEFQIEMSKIFELPLESVK